MRTRLRIRVARTREIQVSRVQIPSGPFKMGVFRDFPFATTFVVAGFLLGFSVLFSTDFFVSYDISMISQDPAGSLFNYIGEYSSELWSVVVEGLALGVVLGFILGFGGFVIDFMRRDSVTNHSSSMSAINNPIRREV